MNDRAIYPGSIGEFSVRVLSSDRPGLLRNDPLADLFDEKSDLNRYPLDHSGGSNPASSSSIRLEKSFPNFHQSTAGRIVATKMKNRAANGYTNHTEKWSPDAINIGNATKKRYRGIPIRDQNTNFVDNLSQFSSPCPGIFDGFWKILRNFISRLKPPFVSLRLRNSSPHERLKQNVSPGSVSQSIQEVPRQLPQRSFSSLLLSRKMMYLVIIALKYAKVGIINIWSGNTW